MKIIKAILYFIKDLVEGYIYFKYGIMETIVEVVDSIKMKGDNDFVSRCKCEKEYPVPMIEGDGEWRKIKVGDSYNYSFDEGKYYVRTYSPDFVPGKNGKIVEEGSCSTLFLTPEQFEEHFTIE